MKTVCLAAGTLMLFCASLQAAQDNKVSVTGSILDNSCIVAPASAEQTVQMGDVASKQFGDTGSTLLPVRFTVDLQQCGPAANGVTLTFTGSQDTANPDLLAINGGSGSASGLGIAILDERQVVIPLNKASQNYPLDPTLVDNVLTFYAQYTSTAPAVSAGTANASATFSLTYE